MDAKQQIHRGAAGRATAAPAVVHGGFTGALRPEPAKDAAAPLSGIHTAVRAPGPGPGITDASGFRGDDTRALRRSPGCRCEGGSPPDVHDTGNPGQDPHPPSHVQSKPGGGASLPRLSPLNHPAVSSREDFGLLPHVLTSACGYKQTSSRPKSTSALPPTTANSLQNPMVDPNRSLRGDPPAAIGPS